MILSPTGILTNVPRELTRMASRRTSSSFQAPAFHAIATAPTHRSRRFSKRLPKPTASATAAIASSHPVVAPLDLLSVSPASMSLLSSSLSSDHPMRLGRGAYRPRAHPGRVCLGHLAEKRRPPGSLARVPTSSPSVRFGCLYACVRANAPMAAPYNGCGAPGKISLEDCIRAYTSVSAYAQSEEGKKGELKAGEYADFIIRSNDLTKVSPAQLYQDGAGSPGL